VSMEAPLCASALSVVKVRDVNVLVLKDPGTHQSHFGFPATEQHVRELQEVQSSRPCAPKGVQHHGRNWRMLHRERCNGPKVAALLEAGRSSVHLQAGHG